MLLNSSCSPNASPLHATPIAACLSGHQLADGRAPAEQNMPSSHMVLEIDCKAQSVADESTSVMHADFAPSINYSHGRCETCIPSSVCICA